MELTHACHVPPTPRDKGIAATRGLELTIRYWVSIHYHLHFYTTTKLVPIMSRAAKLTLAGTSLMAAGTVLFVHYAQQSEKAVSPSPNQRLRGKTRNISSSLNRCYDKILMLFGLKAMHAGVLRDIEQQRVKKERQADFEMQKALEEEYRRVQSVHDGAGEGHGASG